MIPIRNNNNILFGCLNPECKKRFWADGNKQPEKIECPYCKSKDHTIITTDYDHRERKTPDE